MIPKSKGSTDILDHFDAIIDMLATIKQAEGADHYDLALWEMDLLIDGYKLLCEENKQLQTAVDQLPRTADGVPITASDVVYSRNGESTRLSWQVMHYSHWYYSTPEAAEAARSAGGGDAVS